MSLSNVEYSHKHKSCRCCCCHPSHRLVLIDLLGGGTKLRIGVLSGRGHIHTTSGFIPYTSVVLVSFIYPWSSVYVVWLLSSERAQCSQLCASRTFTVRVVHPRFQARGLPCVHRASVCTYALMYVGNSTSSSVAALYGDGDY